MLEPIKEYEKKIKQLEADISNLENYYDIERCESCGLLNPKEVMTYVANEMICENCINNGYGR